MSTAVAAAHFFIRSRVRRGACVVDATAGNGRDTVFLAELVGESGGVHACDVQAAAVTATRSRWQSMPAPKGPLYLYHLGHESLAAALGDAGVTQVDAIMFNLGYLPGGDHHRITQPDTTLAALGSLLPLLQLGGALTVVAYPRHPGGREEADAVVAWARLLPATTYQSAVTHPLNAGPDRPFLISVAAGPEPAS